MVYGSFYKNAIKTKVNKPENINNLNKFKKVEDIIDFTKYKINNNSLSKYYKENKNINRRGGREVLLSKLNRKKSNTNNRDYLNYKSYEISAGLNFGCISIRECYYKINDETIIRQLYWRDFYMCILRYIPYATSYKRHIDNRFDKLKWSNSKKYWKLLIESKTGFLMIDAGMRQLIKTGYINNRMRLLLGTFWIKYLLIHPFHSKYGSQVGFSKYLVDCNTSQNKLNHQWFMDLDLSGRRFSKSGCNPLTGRMIRVDNEMIKKYDPDCEYIKYWMPELNEISNKELYKWNEEIQKKYNIHVKPIFEWEARYMDYCKLFK